MEICVFCFVITFKIVFATYNASGHGHNNDFQMTITPGRSINVTEGQHLKVTCSITYPVGHGAALYWQAQGKGNGLIKQTRVNGSTVMLVVAFAKRADAGFYKCIYNNSKDPIMWKGVFVSVISKSKDGAKCSHTQFLCETDKHCIFLRYRCDGVKNCKDGSDEKDCDNCIGKWPCHNGNCIDISLVCDENHEDHCGDWSDEYCLIINNGRFNQVSEKTATFNITAKDKEQTDHMAWLKTTVYAVIGCTVSVVLFISIIVVAVFRIRMKRDAFRQTERTLESRRNRPVSGTHTNNRNNDANLEQESFIPSTYGNIIVNVNNGVQYVPGVDFTPIMCPPSYSDVERETNARQGSPPPDYSTVDRNPQRPNLLFVNSSNNVRTTINPSPTIHVMNLSSNQNVNNESFSDVELNPAVTSVATQTPPASFHNSGGNQTSFNEVTLPNTNLILCQGGSSSAQPRQPHLDIQGGEIVLSGRENSCSIEHSEQNINRGSRILQVHDGNLILTNERSENMPRHSNAHDGSLVLTNENAICNESAALLPRGDNNYMDNLLNENQRNDQPAHLQVHEGQIVLASHSLPTTAPTQCVSNDNENENVRRDIDVKEGQIIFK